MNDLKPLDLIDRKKDCFVYQRWNTKKFNPKRMEKEDCSFMKKLGRAVTYAQHGFETIPGVKAARTERHGGSITKSSSRLSPNTIASATSGGTLTPGSMRRLLIDHVVLLERGTHVWLVATSEGNDDLYHERYKEHRRFSVAQRVQTESRDLELP